MTTVSSLNPATRLYVLAVIVAGFGAVAESAISLAAQPADARWLLLAALTLASGSANVRLTAVSATISVSETFVCTSVLLFGAGAGTLTVTLDAIVMSFWIKRRYRSEFYRLLFNVAAPALSVWIAAQTFFALAGVPPLSRYEQQIRLVDLALPLLIFTLTYFLLNSWLIAFAIALKERLSAFVVWRDNLLWTSFNYFGGASVAALLIGYRFDVGLLLVIAPILLVLYFTFRSAMGRIEDSNRHLGELNKLYFATIETLATAIDAKDQVTHGHIRRVQSQAVGLAKLLGVVNPEQLKAVEAAALLHDMGKLAVPEHILNKPGKLTAAEFDRMKTHAAVGADILSSIEFPYPVVPIVRHHHENWDGTGYPDGLKGTEIPVGARILSVVDCFDALTSDRPYRPRLPTDEAVRILRERRGTMYDPWVVDAFIAEYGRLSDSRAAPTSASDKPGIAAITQAAGARPDLDDVVWDSPGARSPSDLVAIHELGRTLATQEVAPRHVAELVGKHLQNLVHFRLCVFYQLDPLRNHIAVVHSSGLNSNLADGLIIGLGQRLSGWVAVNRGTIINSDPVLDLGESARLTDPALTSSLSVALTAAGELSGVLSLYSDRRFTQDDTRVVELVARHIGAAFRCAREAEMRRTRLIDPATGLPTLEYLKDLIRSEIESSLGGEQPTTVVLLRIDGFRSQSAGDLFISSLVESVKGTLRASDLLFRLSDTEFGAVLTQTDAETARHVAGRIRTAVCRNRTLAVPRVLIGTATAPSDGDSIEQLLSIAALRLHSEPMVEDGSSTMP